MVVGAGLACVEDADRDDRVRRRVCGEDDDVVADRDVGERDVAVAVGIADREDRGRVDGDVDGAALGLRVVQS